MNDDCHPSRAYGRRTALLVALASAAVLLPRESAAQSAPAPPIIQASLLAKVAYYDRNFAARAIDRAKMLLVAKPGDPDSIRVVMDMRNALGSIATVGGLPHDEEIMQFIDAATVARTCGSHRISIVYFGPGLADEIHAIRAALTSLDVLSVAAVPEYVPQGIVLGFSLVSGGARLLLHRSQANAQNVKFRARILRRMTIYE
jgi:hypothetical protein